VKKGRSQDNKGILHQQAPAGVGEVCWISYPVAAAKNVADRADEGFVYDIVARSWNAKL
jgi:hypothetical protein